MIPGQLYVLEIQESEPRQLRIMAWISPFVHNAVRMIMSDAPSLDLGLYRLLFGLTVIFALSNVAAIALGQTSADRTHRAVPWLQRSTSAQLAVIAWLFWIFTARGTVLSPAVFLLSTGMSCSFIADLIMAGMIRLPNRVIGGIVVFGLVHGLYITSYLEAWRVTDDIDWTVLLRSLLAWAMVGFILWAAFVRNPAAPRALSAGAAIYTVLVASMVAVAMALAFSQLRFRLLAPGALLFLISDLLLGNHLFRKKNWPYVSEVVWLTYITGQCCMLWALITFWKVA